MQKRNVLNSPRLLELKKKRQRVFLDKILLSLLALVIIFICLAYISRIPSLNINDIEVTGNKVVDTSVVKTFVQKEITGNYLWLFPKTNLLFYPKNRIQKDLSIEFKRLNDISLSIKNSNTLEVELDERVPLYTWCGVTMPDLTNSSTEKCYFLDKDGYIFDEAPYFSGEVYFKFYGQAEVGTYFSKENFQQLISFKNTLEAINLKPISLYISDAQTGDIKIFLSSSNKTQINPYITFKTDSDFQNVAENLQSALSTEPLQTEFKNKYSSLQYIDLRFGNKVYYRFAK